MAIIRVKSVTQKVPKNTSGLVKGKVLGGVNPKSKVPSIKK